MNIKKIIREEIENSWDWTGDIEPMEPAMMWLKDNFSNLELGEDSTQSIKTYRNPQGELYFYQTGNYIHIDQEEIWSKLSRGFGLEYYEIRDVISDWLSQEPYNLKGFIPIKSDFSY